MLKSKPIAFIAPMIALAISALTAAGASAAAPDAPWRADGTQLTESPHNGMSSEAPLLYYKLDQGLSIRSDFTATARDTRKQPVTWTYNIRHVTWQPTASISKFVIRDGVEIVRETLRSGPVACCDVFWDGTTEFDLRKGDVYGFSVRASQTDARLWMAGYLRLELPDRTPPTVTPVVTGTRGADGETYVSDVKVAWKIDDAESAARGVSGCGETTVSADTPQRRFTCTAESGGGSATNSVTITRDTTPPTIDAPEQVALPRGTTRIALYNEEDFGEYPGSDPAVAVIPIRAEDENALTPFDRQTLGALSDGQVFYDQEEEPWLCFGPTSFRPPAFGYDPKAYHVGCGVRDQAGNLATKSIRVLSYP